MFRATAGRPYTTIANVGDGVLDVPLDGVLDVPLDGVLDVPLDGVLDVPLLRIISTSIYA